MPLKLPASSSRLAHHFAPVAMPCHGFSLAHGQAMALYPQRSQLLTLSCGRAWLTRSGDDQDYVAEPGDLLRLEAGERWVLEPLDAGLRFELDAVLDVEPKPESASTPLWAVSVLAVPALRLVAFAAGFLAAGLALAERSAASIAMRAQAAIKGRESMASSGAVM